MPHCAATLLPDADALVATRNAAGFSGLLPALILPLQRGRFAYSTVTVATRTLTAVYADTRAAFPDLRDPVVTPPATLTQRVPGWRFRLATLPPAGREQRRPLLD